jgi:proline iminopeptidase
VTPRSLYPPLEPYAVHRLPVGDGHELHVEEAGNPEGTPVVFLHGGPGGGLIPAFRRFFDPARYRIVLFDQRGCGRSTPLGELAGNTTADLVGDIERVREHRGIDSWLVFGGSWGATLGLAYAQAHARRVTGLILRGIWLARRQERDWMYQGGGLQHLQPEEWRRFLEPIPPGERGDVLAAYHRRLLGGDAEAHRCARAWMRWEAVNSSLVPDPAWIARLTADDTVLPAARILAQYAVHGCWFTSESQLLDGVDRIRHLPAVIIQARYDLCCPPATAHELASRWPEAEFHIVPGAGHSSLEPATTDALIRATDAFVAPLTNVTSR